MRASILLILGFVSLSCVAPTLRNPEPTSADSRLMATRLAGPPRRVVLITVAGLESADFLNAWGKIASEGDSVRMPHLARLGREGVIGVAAHPPTPGSSYPAHATIATGRLPNLHGVIADQAFDDVGHRLLPFWDNRLLKGTALWDAAIGRGVLSLGWPTTTGARIELLVPDGRPTDSTTSWLDYMRDRSSPVLIRELEALSELAVESDRPEAEDNDLRAWPTAIEKDAAFAELACRVVASDRDPGLWMIRFDQTVSHQRAYGFGSVEVSQALGRIDTEIGRIASCLEAAGQLDETAIIVTGDVAYQPVHTRVDPNVILTQSGLIGRDPRSRTGVRSWLALSRSNGRSAYVYARDAASAVAARELLEEGAARTGAFEVVSAADLADAGSDPQAWFGLAAMPGFVIGNGLLRPELRASELRASAGAFPFRDSVSSSVGFVAWGRGIRSGVRVPELRLADIAPTIAALLGLRLDDELDGEPLIGVLRAVVPPPPPGPKRLGVGGDADVDRTLRELRGGRTLGSDR